MEREVSGPNTLHLGSLGTGGCLCIICSREEGGMACREHTGWQKRAYQRRMNFYALDTDGKEITYRENFHF